MCMSMAMCLGKEKAVTLKFTYACHDYKKLTLGQSKGLFLVTYMYMGHNIIHKVRK